MWSGEVKKSESGADRLFSGAQQPRQPSHRPRKEHAHGLRTRLPQLRGDVLVGELIEDPELDDPAVVFGKTGEHIKDGSYIVLARSHRRWTRGALPTPLVPLDNAGGERFHPANTLAPCKISQPVARDVSGPAEKVLFGFNRVVTDRLHDGHEDVLGTITRLGKRAEIGPHEASNPREHLRLVLFHDLAHGARVPVTGGSKKADGPGETFLVRAVSHCLPILTHNLASPLFVLFGAIFALILCSSPPALAREGESLLDPVHAKVADRVQSARQAKNRQQLEKARSIVRSLLPMVEGIPNALDDKALTDLMSEGQDLALDLEDLETNLALSSWILQARRRHRKPDDFEVVNSIVLLAGALDDVGRSNEALPLYREALAVNKAAGRGGTQKHARYRANLAICLENLGEVDAAVELFEASYREILEISPPGDLTIMTATFHYARALFLYKGELVRAQELLETVRKALPADHRFRDVTDYYYAQVLEESGDLRGALALSRQLLDLRRKKYPPGSQRIKNVEDMVATLSGHLGDQDQADALIEKLLAESKNTEMTVLTVRQWEERAGLLVRRGDVTEATALRQKVLSFYEELDAPDDLRLLVARRLLAETLMNQRNPIAARSLLERNMEAHIRLQHDHRDELKNRLLLAKVMTKCGDHYASLGLFRTILDALEARSFPGDDEVIRVRGELANLFANVNDMEQAKNLHELNLKELSARFPPGHLRIQKARLSLAYSLPVEEKDRALELVTLAKEELHRLQNQTELEIWADGIYVYNIIRGDDPIEEEDAIRARTILDQTLEISLEKHRRGDQAGGLLEQTRRLRAGFFFRTGQTKELLSELLLLVDEFERQRLRIHGLLGSRAALEFVTDDSASALSAIIRFSEGLEDSTLARRIFEVFETLQCLITTPQSALESISPRDTPSNNSLEALMRGVLKRDARERSTDRENQSVTKCDLEDLLEKMPDNSAYVAIFDALPGSLTAFVLQKPGGGHRILLGSESEIKERVEAWKMTPGLTASRGLQLVQNETSKEAIPSEEAPGHELRRLALDPILSLLPKGMTIFFRPAGPYHLFHPGTLPTEGGLVGDDYPFRFEVSSARLLGASPKQRGDGNLVLVGGVDYGETQADSHGFVPLPGAAREVLSLEEIWMKTKKLRPQRLGGSSATKEMLRSACVGARFLHLATHGYFAREFARNFKEPFHPAWAGQDEASLSIGLFPLLLNGLALSKANEAPQGESMSPGILTAEELSRFPLSDCEMAVLSACETNVGLSRRGQGIHSLRTALHQAGVGTSVSSLWSVPDGATTQVMENFYRRLWVDGEAKADALWNAQMDMRNSGAPVSAWAGWVLTGNPH